MPPHVGICQTPSPEDLIDVSYNSLDNEKYDNSPFNLWTDRIIAVATGVVIGVAIADLGPEYIPNGHIEQIGLAAIVEQCINGAQLTNHYLRPDGRTWKQQLKRAFRDDPYRIAGIYIGQLAASTMMH